MLTRIARPKKLELGSCWHDLHQAQMSGSSFPNPCWLVKLLALVSIALCEVERIQESGIVQRHALTNWLLSTIRQQLRLSVCEWWCLLNSNALKVNGFDWCHYWQQSYLVDPASSHMLVSKIKPCMSKYKQLYTVKLRTAHYISNNLFDGFLLHG